MRERRLKPVLISLITGALLCGCAPSTPPPETTQLPGKFNAAQAWDEFEGELRLRYAYLERDDFDVEAVLSRTKPLALKTETKAEFRKILHGMTYAFTDPHFIIGPFEDTDFNIIPTSSDLQIAQQNGEFVVIDVRADSAADEAGIRPGWRLKSAGGQTVAAQVTRITEKFTDAPTNSQTDYAATLIANGLRKFERDLVFDTDGKIVNLTLPSPRDFAFTVSEMPIVETSVKDGIGIIRINNALGNNDLITEFDATIKEMSGTDGLIIDLRNTPSGGNTEVGRSIIGHFVKDTQPYQIHEIPSLAREFTVPRRFIEMVKPRAPYYDPARAVVLGGYWTGSMGEGLVIGLDGAAGMHTIASDMGDLLGGLSNVNLQASGARMDLGTETLFHVNGSPREDYVARASLISADRDKGGQDPAMQAALEYLAQ